MPPQGSVLASGSAEAAEPVPRAQGDSAGCCHRGVHGAGPVPAVPEQLSQQDSGFLSQSSALLVAQMYTQSFTSLRLRRVNKATKIWNCDFVEL